MTHTSIELKNINIRRILTMLQSVIFQDMNQMIAQKCLIICLTGGY